MLAFVVGNDAHTGILEADDIHLAICARAIFAADNFANITAHEDHVSATAHILVL